MLAKLRSMLYCVNMHPMNEKIRKGVKVALAQNGMTQSQLATEVGLTPQYLSQIMTGQRGDVPEAWQKIFDRLGLELVVREKAEAEQ